MRTAHTMVAHAAAFTLLVALAGCASAPVAGPEGIARLERDRAEHPASAPVLRSLGIAYYKAGRFDDARSALAEANRLEPRDGTTALYLGLTAEQQKDYPAARSAYSGYIRFGRTSRVRRELEQHLAALQRKELEAAAKKAVAQERELGQARGAPTTVAVLPLTFSGPDTSLRPLERGFAELLTTDLSRSHLLTVVERARIQALLDEMALQQSGQVDSTTQVRAGRILQAGRMVQGSILQQGENLRVDAAVIDVPTSAAVGSAADSRTLDQLFTIEKNIALSTFRTLGVTLTIAEENAIQQRPTRNLAAFLAYSRGLEAEDAGRYDDASRFYRQATSIDPNFRQAQQKGEHATTAAAGATITTQTVEGSLQGTTEGTVASAASQGTVVSTTGGGATTSGAGSSSLGGTAASTADGLNPSPTGTAVAAGTGGTTAAPPSKDPAAAGTGTDNPASQTAKVTIVVKYPKP